MSDNGEWFFPIDSAPADVREALRSVERTPNGPPRQSPPEAISETADVPQEELPGESDSWLFPKRWTAQEIQDRIRSLGGIPAVEKIVVTLPLSNEMREDLRARGDLIEYRGGSPMHREEIEEDRGRVSEIIDRADRRNGSNLVWLRANGERR